MLTIREAIVVEGRYDKNTLSQVVDTLILETNGFGIFKDPERMSLLRRAAERRGLIVLTDSDGAGFVIRNRIRGSIPAEHLKHAYIPDVYGKEKRKRQRGREAGAASSSSRPVSSCCPSCPVDFMARSTSPQRTTARRHQGRVNRRAAPISFSTG